MNDVQIVVDEAVASGGSVSLAVTDALTAATTTRDNLDQRITDLLVFARQQKPPIPLEVLAKATGMTVSGVSIRVSRALPRKSS